MKNEKYQGWTNAQTWCVALTFDNTKILQNKIVSRLKVTNDFTDKTPIEVQRNGLNRLILDHHKEIVQMAPWVWESQRFPEFVDLDQLIKHFEAKGE